MARTIRNTVHVAAKELDALHPGWAYKVRMDRLDLSSHLNCVLGQLYGDYSLGLEALDVSHNPELDEATIARFDAPRLDRYHDEWKRQIRARRGRSGTNRNPQILRNKLGLGPRTRRSLATREAWAH